MKIVDPKAFSHEYKEEIASVNKVSKFLDALTDRQYATLVFSIISVTAIIVPIVLAFAIHPLPAAIMSLFGIPFALFIIKTIELVSEQYTQIITNSRKKRKLLKANKNNPLIGVSNSNIEKYNITTSNKIKTQTQEETIIDFSVNLLHHTPSTGWKKLQTNHHNFQVDHTQENWREHLHDLKTQAIREMEQEQEKFMEQTEQKQELENVGQEINIILQD